MEAVTYSQFRQFASTNGDGTGTTNIIGNYAAAATDFYVQPSSTQIFLIGAVIVSISDNGSFGQTDYGAITGGVTNGITGFIKLNGVEVNAFGTLTFKQNIDWFGTGSNITLSSFTGGAQTMNIVYETFADTGGYIRLDGRSGDRIGLRANDDFTTLVRQTMIVRGVRLTEPWLVR